MIRISQLKLEIPHNEEQIRKQIAKKLKLKNGMKFSMKIVKRSLDARKKPVLFYSYVVDVALASKKMEESTVRFLKKADVTMVQEKHYEFPENGNLPMSKRPVVIGSGPAGLFCALMLARNGFKPVLLERGSSVEKRQQQVDAFWKGEALLPDSNVQFGEGGAGTFSDGKLNTLVKDVSGRNHKVLEEFVKAGADEKILYENKPHLGTDVLIKIVSNMRNEILSLGGEVRFEAKVTDFRIEDGQIQAVCVNDKEWIESNHVVLAIGHSARDTFALLKDREFHMEQKAFAMGIRIEHPQKMINLSQYGAEEVEGLGAADYKLTAKATSGRSVYTFCMCPGGFVVNASSEEKRLAVNGMSYSKRDSKNANSAVLVTVDEKDFGSDDVLAGVELQRRLEEKAYQAGNGKIPVQLYGDFKENRTSEGFGSYEPQMKGLYELGNVRTVFPEEIGESIAEGIALFDARIKGFAREDAIISGVESRSSSPVRIVRDDSFQSNIRGIYPCGEGAGYAGGITSAAMDGIKVAEAIAKSYHLV